MEKEHQPLTVNSDISNCLHGTTSQASHEKTTSTPDAVSTIKTLKQTVRAMSNVDLDECLAIVSTEIQRRPDASAERAKKQAVQMRLLWGRYRDFAITAKDILGPNARAKLWESDETGEKRIYFNVMGSQFQTIFFVTGNRTWPPKSFNYGSSEQRELIAPKAVALIDACNHIIKLVSVMYINLDTAAAWQDEPTE